MEDPSQMADTWQNNLMRNHSSDYHHDIKLSLRQVHQTMVDWRFPGDTCEAHCKPEANLSEFFPSCWAVQPWSSLTVILVSISFTIWSIRHLLRGGTLAQSTCIFAFGWFEFVHGLSHLYGHGIEHLDFYVHASFYLLLFGIGWALHEQVGQTSSPSITPAWKLLGTCLLLIDFWLLSSFGVNLYNVALGLLMVQFTVCTFIGNLDEISRIRWLQLSLPQFLLLVAFINEGFNCDVMMKVTNSKVPFHAFFEIIFGAWTVLFVRTVISSTGHEKGNKHLKLR